MVHKEAVSNSNSQIGKTFQLELAFCLKLETSHQIPTLRCTDILCLVLSQTYCCLCHKAQHSDVLHNTVLQSTLLHCTTQHSTLQWSSQHCPALHNTVLHSRALQHNITTSMSIALTDLISETKQTNPAFGEKVSSSHCVHALLPAFGL